ncbi:MAG: His-Xaa-Ser system protein HxsD [Nanoarchaeota archaeon]|nr:His-Xaa-Ser system protein HxsD [Nanoarchaeota archaeon]
MKKISALGNIEIDENSDYILFSINPRIYSLDIIHSAAYIMLDKAYIILDYQNENILVEIRAKHENQDLKQLTMEFNEELLNYAVYKAQSERNKEIRQIILQRSLLTNNPDYFIDTSTESPQNEDEIKDPKGISKKWDEKDGKDKNKKK